MHINIIIKILFKEDMQDDGDFIFWTFDSHSY